MGQARAVGEEGNLGFILLVVAVATLGGFMFGYGNSGAINSTTKGLATAFGLDEANLGLTASSLLPGCALGAFLAGRLADVWGRKRVMLVAAVLFIFSALAAGGAPARWSSPAPVPRGRGGRRGVGPVTGLYLQGDPRLAARAAVLDPADHDHHRPVRRGDLQHAAPARGGGLAGADRRPCRLALDVLGAGSASGAVPRLVAVRAGEPALPRRQGADGRSARRAHPPVRQRGRATRRRGDQGLASRRPPAAPVRSRDPATGKWRTIVWVGIGLAVFQQFVGINVVFYYGIMLWEAVGYGPNRRPSPPR